MEGPDPDNVWAIVRLAVGNRVVTVNEVTFEGLFPSRNLIRALGSQPGEQNFSRGNSLVLGNLPGSRAPHPAGSRREEKEAPSRPTRGASIQEGEHKPHKYYNTKMTIEDVFCPDTWMCQTDEGQVLEGVSEDMLETLVPKVQGSRVMVVLGPRAGRWVACCAGTESRARPCSPAGESQLVEPHCDAVCEHVGPWDPDRRRLTHGFTPFPRWSPAPSCESLSV